MPYLKQFTVDNFKAFAEGNTVPIRPITLLFGPNSAGKSSVLHALKLYSELLTRHHLYPVGYPLGNWLHDRQPGTEIRLGAEVGLLPTEVGGSTDLNEATHSINVEVKLSLEPIRNYWGEIDRPKEPFVEEVALKINGVKALVLKGMPHISETKTERRIEWTALELREVDWSIAEFSFVIDAMLNRISNRLNWPESYLKDIKLKNTIRNHIQKGFENELFVRASDLLSGRINLLHVWDDEDRQVTFYSRRREPEAQFFQSAIQLFPGQLLDLFNKAIGLHYEDEYVGFRYREALDNAFQGEIEKIVGFLYEYHSKDLDEMQSLLQSLENQRNTWEEIKEVSRLMSFGLEDLVQTVSQLFKPVVEIMEQLRMVGPVREVGDVTVGRDASWQAMLDDPDVRKRVNEWLARLGLNYEVVPARWIDEEYLETTVRTTAYREAERTARKMLGLFDTALRSVDLQVEQQESIWGRLRELAQAEDLRPALGFKPPREPRKKNSDDLFFYDELPLSGLSKQLQSNIKNWFPDKGIADYVKMQSDGFNPVLKDSTDEIEYFQVMWWMNYFNSFAEGAESQQMRTSEMPSILKLRDKVNNLLLDDTELGVGISQLLPVLARAATPGLVIIEQPELHIHPSLQAGIADIMIEAVGSGRTTLMLETHSEHLILRLLRRIRETTDGEQSNEHLHFTPVDLSVLYVFPAQQGQAAHVRELAINEEGELEGRWPRGFFADRSQDLM